MSKFKPMPRTRTVAQILNEYLASENPPAAIIFLDGEELMICDSESEGRQFARETESKFPDWREISLMVYKPRHRSYLRASMTCR